MTSANIDYQNVYRRVVADPRYATGITYGKPRAGHSEGTVQAHIAELELNLESLKPILRHHQEYWQLKVLIHVHDTFKYWAKRNSSINDPESHATLARNFLAEFIDDNEMLDMVQYHDESFALSRQFEQKNRYSVGRLVDLIKRIRNFDLFMLFVIIDTYTAGKMHDAKWRIRWFYDEVKKYSEVNLIQTNAALEKFQL